MSGRLAGALRGAVALLAVGASLLIAPAAAAQVPTPQVPTTQTPAAQSDQAVQDYAACLNGRKVGDLLLLVDESGSLERTDPEGRRVTAAKLLLEQLAGRAEGAGIALDVQIAGFATEFDRDPGAWTPLTEANLAGLTAEVDGFAARDDGRDTDYWTALDGARRSLADHRTVGAGEAGRCQAIAWFSDGRLDITAPTAQQRQNEGSPAPTTNDAAREALCAPQGTAEQLRQAGIWMFGIGLAPPGTPADEFDVMRSITTGRTAGGGTCGTTTDPAPGTFTPAADIDELLRAFNQLLGPVDVGGPPTPVCVATDTVCRGQEFVLDGSIDSVNIFGQADTQVSGLTAELVGPNGDRTPLSVTEPGRRTELRLGASTGTYSWPSPRTVVIDLDREGSPDPAANADGWRGVWALRFVAPQAAGQSTTNIRVTGNLRPAWVDQKDSLPTGADQQVTLGLVRTDGTGVDTSRISGTYRLGAALIDSTGRPVGNASLLADNTTGPVTLPLSRVAEGPYTLRLTLDLTTAPARRSTGEAVPGTRLVQQQVDLPFRVDPPLGYPPVPPSVDFGTAEDGATELTARMPVTGPGCVWVPADPAPTVATLPTGTGAVTVTADGATSAQSCLKLADGQTGEVVLHLRADRAGNGTATGTLPVALAPADRPDQARTVDVPFTGDLRNPINQLNFWLTLIVALILGPGIPLGLLYLVKWSTARIPAANGLYARTIPVTVQGGRTLRDGTTFRFHDGDFVALADVPTGGTRRLVVDGEVELRTRTGRSPFGAGHVSVEPVEGTGLACLAPGETQPLGYRLATRLPLAVHGKWVVLHRPAGPPHEALVLVLVGADTSAAARERLAADIADRLPAVLDRLRGKLEEWGRSEGGAGDGGAPPSGPRAGEEAPAYGPSVPAPSGHAGGGYGPPGGGYGPPAGGSYGPPAGGGYGPPAGGGYGPPAGGSYSPPAGGSYSPSGGGGSYGPPAGGGYGPPAGGSYGPPAGGSYGPPAGGGYGPPSSGSAYGPPSDGGAYSPPSDGSAWPSDTRGDTTPLPSPDPPDGPDLPQSWGPPTYGPRT